MNHRSIIALLLGVQLLASVVVHARIRVVAATGDPSPDANGAFSYRFSQPVLNDTGQVAFFATLSGTRHSLGDDVGIFRGTGAPGTLTSIVRKGDPLPGGNGTFYFPELFEFDVRPLLNNAGQVAFVDPSGIFRADGTLGGLVDIAPTGSPAPDGNGTFTTSGVLLALNDSGQVAFVTHLSATSGDGSGDKGVFRGDENPEDLTQIARSGQLRPNGDGSFAAFYGLDLNDAGEVGFRDGNHIFQGNEVALKLIASEGQASPSGKGTLYGFADPVFNEAGQAAFIATVIGGDETGGIFIAGQNLIEVTGQGGAAPDGNGQFPDAGGASAITSLDDDGATFWLGHVVNSDRANDYGIFRGDGTSIVQLARAGQAAPRGGILVPSAVAVNENGRVAFVASLFGTSGLVPNGIFVVGDGTGVVEVVREGDAMLGSSVDAIRFRTGTSRIGGAINALGQVAFSFSLIDGRQGIAIWSEGSDCTGDCDAGGTVSITELLRMINIALRSSSATACRAGDANDDGAVGIDEIVAAVKNELRGCN